MTLTHAFFAGFLTAGCVSGYIGYSVSEYHKANLAPLIVAAEKQVELFEAAQDLSREIQG